MKIGVNKFQFYSKITFLATVLCLFGLFIYYRPSIKFNNAPIVGIIFLIVVWTLLILLFVLMVLQLFILPKGVEIDDKNRRLILKFVIAKSLTVAPKDINEFCTIVLKTKATNYEGLLIRIKNGKEYVISDANLKTFKPIETFLQEAGVPFTGYYKFSFFSYFVRYFKQ